MLIRTFAAALLVLSATGFAQTEDAYFPAKLTIQDVADRYLVDVADAYPLHHVVLLLSDTMVPSHLMDMGPWGLVSVDVLAPVVIPIGVADALGSAHYEVMKPAALPPHLEDMDLFLKVVSLAYTVVGNPPVYTPFIRFTPTESFVLASRPSPDEMLLLTGPDDLGATQPPSPDVPQNGPEPTGATPPDSHTQPEGAPDTTPETQSVQEPGF